MFFNICVALFFWSYPISNINIPFFFIKTDVFLISDGYSISTSDLLNKISYFSKIQLSSFELNKNLLSIIFKLFFLKKYYKKLFYSQEIDIEYTKKTLDWKPNDLLDDTLESMFNE